MAIERAKEAYRKIRRKMYSSIRVHGGGTSDCGRACDGFGRKNFIKM